MVRRVRKSKDSFYDEIPLDSVSIVIRGPYEKNIADILYNEKPWLKTSGPKFAVLKRVVDLMHDQQLHKFCVADDYEREKS